MAVEGPTSLRACRSEAQLGITLQTADRSDEARPLLEHAVTVLPETEPLTHGAHYRLASALSSLGEDDRAVRVAETGVGLLISTFGRENPTTFAERQNLAVLQWNVGDLGAAHQILTEVLSDNAKVPEPERQDLSQAQEWLRELEAELEG